MTIPRDTKLSYTLYAVASAAFIFYFGLELNGEIQMWPLTRIALLGSGCAGIYSGSLLRARASDPKTAALIMRRSFVAFFALYVLLLLTFTLFDDAFGRNENALMLFDSLTWERAKESINLIPFHTIMLYIRGLARGAVSVTEFAVNLFGNLLAFSPMAFFLPLLFKRQRSWYGVAVTTAVCVSAVELLQLVFQKGSCDVDDLLLNTAGAAAAYFIVWSKRGAAFVDKFTCGARFAQDSKRE